MKNALHTLAILALGSACLAAAAAPSAHDAGIGDDAPHASAKVQLAPASRGLARSGRIRAAHVRPFNLEVPPADLARSLRPPSKFSPMQVGVHRDVPALATSAATGAALQWEGLPDGSRVAALSITSPTAASLRAGVLIENLPDDAVVRFQAPGDSTVFEFSGEEINAVVARNVRAERGSAYARVFWSPLVDGDTLVLEVELPASGNALALRISVPSVSHLFTSSADGFAIEKLAAGCEIDACSAPSTQMNAVARMLFGDGSGSMFYCTGTLLADQDPASSVPYFLSANHCISTQVAASSLTTLWFYRSAPCLAPTSSSQLSGGATLLYQTSNTDTSFMRLNSAPPAGVVFSGWTAAGAAIGTLATGLYHPTGDVLKISTGSTDGYLTCTPPTNGQFSCSTATATTSTFYAVRWTSGITEPGSSGSGLFLSDGSLIAQLYGGSGTCNMPADDIYGRFDVAYNAAIKNWLSGAQLTVTRSGTGSGTVSSAPSGISCGSTCSAIFPTNTSVALTPSASSGSAFTGWTGACTGTNACVVTLAAPATVNATFATVAATATLAVAVTGTGTVTSSPAGINCGTACSASFPSGSSVTLAAVPGGGLVFQGWTGACSGISTCTVTLNGATSVGALFGDKVQPTLALSATPDPSTAGQPVTLTSVLAPTSATGTIGFTYDGNFVSGCSSQPVQSGTASCTTASIPSGSHTIMATYSGDASYTQATSPPLALTVSPSSGTPGTLLGLSTRMQVLTGNNVLIGGFVIGGNSPKTVIVRARGPSLASLGVTGTLADPTLTLVPASGAPTTTNDDWGQAPNASAILASGFAPGNAKESAIMAALPPGAYTAIVSGVGNTTGVALVEVYEIDHPEIPLTGISTRGEVQTGANVMIGGFVIEGLNPQTVIVRARGPSLAAQGVSGALANPTLQLVRAADNTTIAVNDDWGLAPNAAQIAASGYAPADPLESAILVTLNPGAYTALVSGVGGAAGVGIVEVFAQ